MRIVTACGVARNLFVPLVLKCVSEREIAPRRVKPKGLLNRGLAMATELRRLDLKISKV